MTTLYYMAALCAVLWLALWAAQEDSHDEINSPRRPGRATASSWFRWSPFEMSEPIAPKHAEPSPRATRAGNAMSSQAPRLASVRHHGTVTQTRQDFNSDGGWRARAAARQDRQSQDSRR